MKLTGGVEVQGVSPDVGRVLMARSEFIAAYCKERGWDVDNLTIPQILEIRSQDGWKNAQ